MKKKVCEGRISSPFGERIHPVTKVKSFHNGVDISTPIGTPVFTPVNAFVVQVYNHEAGGKTIILKDIQNGDRYGFCHLAEQLVKVGEIISKGTLIAKSGNTGRSTGPHLHFSYATGGKWVIGNCTGFTYKNPVSKIEFQL
ncbi:MAG: M23 family metallopeptidase [Bacteroidales bacterium]|nr:M23 family metallopeptidase [Bacteroidales bacterium]